MSRLRPGSNSIIEHLKSLVGSKNRGALGRRRQRSGFMASESLESREMLSSTSLGGGFTDYQAITPQTTLTGQSKFLTAPTSGEPLTIATAYLQSHANDLGLTVQDISTLQVTSSYQSSISQVTHIYFQQVVNGIPVVNSNLNINITKNGEVISVGSSVLPTVASNTLASNTLASNTLASNTLASNTAVTTPQLTAVQALNSLVSKLGWAYEGVPTVLVESSQTPVSATVISSAGISKAAEIPASLKYVPKGDGTIELAWMLNIQTTDGASWYDAAVSASSGEILNMEDWVAQASYRGVEIPFENPIERAPALIVDPQAKGLAASPFGWHDTDGVAGPEFTDTRGNNVNAQEDKDNNNTGGARPNGGAGLVFDFPFDPTQSAQANENAAIVNLFYWNNVIHDVLYNYGFDETAGNFQFNNYGKGGLGGDPVEADALDGSGTNNANFATPPDGISGRMQMYEFTFTSPTRDSDMDSFIMVHEFGHGLSNRLTGGPANSGALQQAQSRGMGEGWSDFLALMFVQKSSDTQFGAYSTGNYVLGNPLNDPNGGIRDFPYSFDMSISPKTYGYFDANTFPHPNGEIIAATLWDLNWLMINGDGVSIAGQGYEPDIYNFASGAGNTELMKLFVEALKMQPANPTYLDFRDAMLSADLAITGGLNEVAIWTAFARRGMGFSAFDGGSAASGNVREAFDLPPGLLFELIVNPNPVAENAGISNVGGATLTIKRPTSTPVNVPLDVTLTSSDVSEIDVPALVTIPAGSTSVTITINVIDDTELDGTQVVRITGTALIAGRTRTTVAVVNVLDHEILTVQLNPNSVREDAGPGAVSVTVTRSNTDTNPPDTYVVVADQLLRHDYNGVLVSTIPIEWPAGVRPGTENAHDLVMLQNGTIAVYNGTTTGFISVYSPTANTWQHFQISGLTTDLNDPAMGGIASFGQYVFATDMESTPGNPFGIVRLDLTTGAIARFGTQSLGPRLFVKDVFDNNILEVDPITGATLNTLPMPITSGANFGYNNGMAFDGTDLWLLAGGINNNQIYQLDAETGAVKEVHSLGTTAGWDGLAYLNGLIYALDNSAENRITVYDPNQRRVTATLDVGTLNSIDISGGIAGIKGPDRLIVTSTSGDEIYEINPTNGVVTNTWNSGFSSTEYGVGTAAGEIYIGAFQSGVLRVFNRNGVFQRSVDVTLTSPEGVYAIGGDDVPGLTTTSYRYRDVAAGLDDKLYALDQTGTTIGRFDPTTTQTEAFFDVANPVNAIMVGADGTIWGAGQDGKLYHFDSSGAMLSSLVTGVAELIDIDLNITGQLLLTGRDGTVIQGNTTLASFGSFSAGTSPAFITLGRHQTLPAGDAIIQLTSSDITELVTPLQVVIPSGQQSVTVLIDVIDDNILDGTQVVTVSGSAVGYISSADRIDVLDVEKIGVDIVADQISEAAGNGATQARVFRTNVDGPFSFIAEQSGANETSQTIMDVDKIVSQITVPTQTSRLTDVNVTLSLKHTWLTDLDIFLISPNGTRIELMTDLSSNEPFMTNTTFDNRAAGSILDGASPFTGSFLPEGSLEVLNGENPSGIWTLEISDDNASDFGMLFSWSLNFQTIGLAPQVVTLSLTGDPGEIGIQQTVTIPANQGEILVPLNSIDDAILDGTQVAGVQASGVALGFEFSNDSVEVLDQETMTLSLFKSSVFENAGPAAINGKLTRGNTDISLPYTVMLTSSNTNKLTVPTSVTIPANRSSVTFPVNAIDNNIIDGNTLVTLTASAPAYGSDLSYVVTVVDVEPGLKLSTSTPTVAENLGLFTVVVERQDQADLSLPMIVTLTAGPGLSLPATTVTIPANSTTASFDVSVLDNLILDGTRTSTIHASASNITAGDVVVTITDYETLTISVSKTTFLENAGSTASTGTVTRSNTGDLSQALVVNLTSSDTTEATVPATVTIPAGQASVTFPITAVNDTIVEDAQNVTITAKAASFVDGTIGVVVEDHEPPVISAPGATTAVSRPTITWNALAGALRYDVWISNVSTGISQIVRNINVPTNSFVPPENLGIGRYRVWVRAINQQEKAGVWSVGRDFFVNTPPVITSPTPAVTVANSKFPTITWSAVPDATKYELWVNNLTTRRSKVIYLAGTEALTTTSYTSPVDLSSGRYKIWVRALNAQGEAGDWSVGVVDTVLAPPAIAQPIGGGTFDRTPTFSWSAVRSATNYELLVTDVKSKAAVIRNQFITTTTFTALQDLPIGDYKVAVRAQNGNSYSEWSQVTLFSVGLPPRITSAKLVGTPSRPQVTWTTIAGTEKYEIWVANKATNALVINNKALNTTTYTHNAALPAGTYRVWVRAVSTMGEVTAWSSSVDLVIASSAGSVKATETLESTLRTSAVSKAQHIGSKTPIETPEDAVVEDTLIIVEEGTFVVNGIQPVDEAATSVDTAISSVDLAVSDFDAVMAEWQSADWWTESSKPSEKNELKSAAALAASLGLVVRSGRNSDERRKKRDY